MTAGETSADPEPEPESARELEQDTSEVVEGQVVPPERRRHTSRRLDVGWQESRYASPLPSPDDLERYRELLPDAPERLLASGEREQQHRHEIEGRLAAIDEKAMPKFYEGQRRGHFISLALAAGYEAIMLVAVLKGYPIEGISGAAVGLGAMIWAIRRDTGGGDAQAAKTEEPVTAPGTERRGDDASRGTTPTGP